MGNGEKHISPTQKKLFGDDIDHHLSLVEGSMIKIISNDKSLKKKKNLEKV